MTFSQWYNSLEVMNQPQFTDMLHDGLIYRIVYSVDAALWQLSDYCVTTRACEMVYLSKRK